MIRGHVHALALGALDRDAGARDLRQSVDVERHQMGTRSPSSNACAIRPSWRGALLAYTESALGSVAAFTSRTESRIELLTEVGIWTHWRCRRTRDLGWLQQNLGDMPVPNSTELHHTQANIHQAAAQKIRGLSSPECVGVRARDHLLISRLKVRFLHGSPTNPRSLGAAPGPPPPFFSEFCPSSTLRPS